MKRCPGIVVVLLTAAGLACGSSDESAESAAPDAAQPSSEPAAPDAAQPPSEPAAPERPIEELSPEKRELLDQVVWDGLGDARDKLADSDTCEEQIERDPALQGEVHPLVKIDRWMQCMEGFGWKRRQQG